MSAARSLEPTLDDASPVVNDCDAVAPLAVNVAGAARLLGISESHLYALCKTGRFGPAPVKLGRSCRYRVDELRAWLAAELTREEMP